MKMVQERERVIAGILRDREMTDLSGLRVFEPGCSTGYNLRMFVQWGARPENMTGMDIDPAATSYIRERAPGMCAHTGSAEDVPEADGTFDMSIAFTLFSSLPNEGVASAIAAELMRVTRPGGLVLVYDMRRDSPRNRSVHAIRREDIRRWFTHCRVRTRHLTLVPPLARRVPALYSVLAAIPPLRTHSLHIIDWAGAK